MPYFGIGMGQRTRPADNKFVCRSCNAKFTKTKPTSTAWGVIQTCPNCGTQNFSGLA